MTWGNLRYSKVTIRGVPTDVYISASVVEIFCSAGSLGCVADHGKCALRRGIGNWGSVEMDGLFLVVLGVFAHLFGFGLNDIADFSIDRRNPWRQTSPLVSGKLSLRATHVFVWLQLVLAFVWIGAFPFKGDPILVATACGVSILFSIFYNLWSKRGPTPPWVAELSLGGAIGLLLLAGALAQARSVGPSVYVLALAAWLQLLPVNSVPSGLKAPASSGRCGKPPVWQHP